VRRMPLHPTGAASAGDRRRRRTDDRPLLERYAAGRDRADRDRLVRRYLPLARHVAHQYDGPREPFDDLFQVACVGLVHAIDRFDPAREVPFLSYALPTMHGEVKRHFRDRSWSVRVPRGMQELRLSIDRATAELAATGRRAPTVPELAEYLGATPERVLEGIEGARAYQACSLEAPDDNGEDHDGGGTLGDAIPTVEPGYGAAEDRATLDRLLRALPVRERRVIELRYRHDLTQAEIAECVGVSAMHVSRMLRRSIAQLQEAA
jgi:RNA polymerase sigma-B factor